MSNYASSPYNPNSYAPAYDAAFAQAQQHAAALDQLQQMYGQQQYPMVATGQQFDAMGNPIGAPGTPPSLTPLQGAWWQQPTYGIPRWTLAAGALALTGIGLAWQAGVFGKMMGGGGRASSRSRTTVRRSTARDATRGARTTSISRTGPKGGRTTLSTTRPAEPATGARDMSSGRKSAGKRRRKSGAKRRR